MTARVETAALSLWHAAHHADGRTLALAIGANTEDLSRTELDELVGHLTVALRHALRSTNPPASLNG